MAERLANRRVGTDAADQFFIGFTEHDASPSTARILVQTFRCLALKVAQAVPVRATFPNSRSGRAAVTLTPPSTGITTPLTCAARSLDMTSKVAAISSGVAARPIGTCRSIFSHCARSEERRAGQHWVSPRRTR